MKLGLTVWRLSWTRRSMTCASVVYCVASLLFTVLATTEFSIADESTPLPSLIYRVDGVAPTDRLNVREKPDRDAAVVGSFPANASDIVVTGAQRNVAGSIWWEVEVGSAGGVIGWVKRQVPDAPGVRNRRATPEPNLPSQRCCIGRSSQYPCGA
jgi:hypothetical protein